MGATCLVHWKDANGQQSLTLLSERLLKQFHANPIGRWTINWKVFRDTSPVSKSGTGKMLHVVYVQGGATARGVPPGSQAANTSAGSVLSGTGAGLTGNTSAIASNGVGSAISGMAAGTGGMGLNTGSSKTGLGILPPGGPSANIVGAGAGVGNMGGLTSAQAAADSYNSTAWCLIDDGAVGLTSASAASTNNVNTSSNTAGADAAGSKKKAVLVEVEKDIEALIAKLKNLWVHRQHAQVEGYVFDLGDFIVRAGNIMVASTSYKGMLIEIEYLPQTSSAIASNAILEEFVRLISPPGVTLYSPQMLDYPYEQVGLDSKHWSMLHSGFQYMTLFRRQHIL
ncbi:hypothetical protein BX616_003584 [Lobosporangium transversale]|uniref:Mediator of RNA polymerase II transcription subunit 20 n=1 Tax=Lobosporangium transversale TaxID=64571 RepID=A0A1Y2GI08_9FUNG|nr:TATA-binding related factor of subunit 20 of mediator complex-domain-containing protein [Lobosporangium transversale]KAF9916510.1 hypothetical protein BX616_003584 [Lobosporangium transversale]ORZ08036.1 TATA-binding related factor of subunit 20 of mediator complex-domain-containing protein [Lobosporangium transversale]|eukprot:XP_021878270.1 TATA-binding related factor of subunit 20 of mediator complex-domain-containing protein [Lobosporangium transversale]